jgi:ATP-dependent Clp protease ATP-binding subunit ClpA
MFWKILQWVMLAGAVLYIGQTLLSLLPFVLFFVAVIVAVCCVYALLPSNFRLPGIEEWLNPSWQPSPSYSRSPISFTEIDQNNDNDSNSKPSNEPAPTQPRLNFESVIARSYNQLPNREELTAYLRSKVIGQDKAIEELVRVCFGKLAAQNYPKPLVVFLPGPTGTGKTELSKALAESLCTKLHRFDMGEYADAFKSTNLMGSSKGYVGSEEGGALPNALRHSKKRCILLFDEVEKAHQSLWRQLLAFFDEGRISDTQGTVVAPKNTICILTSNLAADKIAEDPIAAKEILKETKFFLPEFIGRIDKFIPLPRLNKTDSARLTVILAKRVAKRYGLSLIIDQEAMECLVAETFEEGEKYGGRGLQEKILDLLSDNFIDLQGQCITHARLVVEGGKLQALPLES